MCLYTELVLFSPIHSGALVLFDGDHTSLCLDVKLEIKHVKMMTLTEAQRSFLLPSLGY
ncbi:rCG20281 [Rattus norvegicus]|uniref:RCG20281 n=1 Tax=Rattus norvegicus TaxID=10116 RepID=A6JH40_RAT|nr:rCG20281 [Rattus norvegicus]